MKMYLIGSSRRDGEPLEADAGTVLTNLIEVLMSRHPGARIVLSRAGKTGRALNFIVSVKERKDDKD